MKRVKQLKKAFGILEEGFAALPGKISNVRVARTVYCEGCSFCFPHGPETPNSTLANQQRSWKRFRRTRWKD